MIKILDNFLTDKECQFYIQSIKEKNSNVPFSNSSLSTNDKYIDHELAKKFYQRLIELDSSLKYPKTLGYNNLIMTSYYKEGENFGIHTDTGLYYDYINKIKTRYTLLIYLNDDFEGGKTIFYDDNFNKTTEIIPKKGSCLIFDINLYHEGTQVISGSKYWIGCEILGSFE